MMCCLIPLTIWLLPLFTGRPITLSTTDFNSFQVTERPVIVPNDRGATEEG